MNIYSDCPLEKAIEVATSLYFRHSRDSSFIQKAQNEVRQKLSIEENKEYLEQKAIEGIHAYIMKKFKKVIDHSEVYLSTKLHNDIDTILRQKAELILAQKPPTCSLKFFLDQQNTYVLEEIGLDVGLNLKNCIRKYVEKNTNRQFNQ